MKNIFKTIFLVALALSCTKEAVNESISEDSRKYNLSFDPLTRTGISGTGSSRSVSWNQGDVVKYYTASNQSSPAESTVKLSGGKASVTIPRARTDEFINAVYGATQLESSSSTENTMYISSTVKSNQRYTTFAEAHVCAAFSDDLEDPDLRFHNVACIVNFTSSADVHKVVFSGNNGETITGGSNGDLKITNAGGALTVESAATGSASSQTSVTISTSGAKSDFYFAILPVCFDSGIKVDCYNADGELFISMQTKSALNTTSAGGSVKMLVLGNVQDWVDAAPPCAIDLGLSVKWASFNLGATKPEECGDYFAWGETEPKSEYKWANYLYGTSKNGPFSEYVLDPAFGTVDYKTVLDLDDDAAHASWAGDWRIPTKEEVAELMDIKNCTWIWTTRNGVQGYRITSRKSGYTKNYIFLPANGMRTGSGISDEGVSGNYWSSSISADGTYFAVSPYFNDSEEKTDNCYRYYGLGIRPVCGSFVPVSSLTIPKKLALTLGRNSTLTAKVLPENATCKNLMWVSSNPSIVSVDAAGKVCAVAPGTAKVTVYSADGAKTASCDVTVDDGQHDYVDLGLPSGIAWATMNVGASKPEEYGDYFAWGETKPKSDYSVSTYKWCNGSLATLTKYCPSNKTSYWDGIGSPDGKKVLDPDDDAAHVNWGGSWRMPTDAEWTELRENCTWTRTDDYNGSGISGRIVTSKKSGYEDRSIFLPAAGDGRGTDLNDVGSCGYYWSSSLYTGSPNCAWSVDFYSSIYFSGVYTHDNIRSYGQSVRPITE